MENLARYILLHLHFRAFKYLSNTLLNVGILIDIYKIEDSTNIVS